MGFPGGASDKEPASPCRGLRDAGSVPGLGRSSGRGSGNSLQYSCLGNPMVSGAWYTTIYRVKSSRTHDLAWKHSKTYQLCNILEKATAPHSSTLAWRIPWMEEPGGLPSMGSHRVRHNWSDLAAAAAAAVQYMHIYISNEYYICLCIYNPHGNFSFFVHPNNLQSYPLVLYFSLAVMYIKTWY